MTLISVDEARATMIAHASVVDSERVALADALGRVLAQPLAARRTQPPFSVSAMDGYAVGVGDAGLEAGAILRVIGEAAAGHGFSGQVKAGEAVRIFTGAPLPKGADAVLIQEHALPKGGSIVTTQALGKGQYVRPEGLDFAKGDVLLQPRARLTPRAIALAASMNHAHIPVRRRPRVAILATGDELVPPGTQTVDAAQIVASNTYGVAAMARAVGASPLDLGIAKDSRDGLLQAFCTARAQRADILVTLGGASVGKHDLVADTLGDFGVTLDFCKIAMRPGKPLLYGRGVGLHVLGLPGNPVSSLVTARVFLQPLIRALLGLPFRSDSRDAVLGCDLAGNDERETYLRARLDTDREGQAVATPFMRQDSAMLAILNRADALVIRKPHAKAARKGEPCTVLLLD